MYKLVQPQQLLAATYQRVVTQAFDLEFPEIVKAGSFWSSYTVSLEKSPNGGGLQMTANELAGFVYYQRWPLCF